MTSASKDRLDLRAQALAYARRGWPVFPLAPKAKTPLTKDGFKSATTDRDTVLAFWSQWPEANVGLATGHGFDVLDLDGPEGHTAFLAYLREHEAEGYVHAGPVSLTGKGFHLLFAPTGSGNRAGLAGAPIDFRGLGGYIVAPPSLHPLGHRYRWDDARRRNEATALPEAPAWLTALLGDEGERLAAAARAVEKHYGPPELTALRATKSGSVTLGRPDILLVAQALNLYTAKQGVNIFARCPFHKGYEVAQVHEGSPSMQLDTRKNNFYCHSCGAYGDSIDLQARRNINGQTF